MFRTSDEHEFAAYPFGYGGGVRMWNAVSLEAPTPYFVICYAVRLGRGWLYETRLLWRRMDVLDFCRQTRQDTERRIHQVSIMLPAEGGKRWHMLELKEIWNDVGAKDPHRGIFITHDGRHLCRSNVSPKATIDTTRELIYVSTA